MSKIDFLTGKRLCDYCGNHNSRFAGTPYMADGSSIMCIDCYKLTYDSVGADEIMPFEMVEQRLSAIGAPPKAKKKRGNNVRRR
jgi:hypothetical protein